MYYLYTLNTSADLPSEAFWISLKAWQIKERIQAIGLDALFLVKTAQPMVDASLSKTQESSVWCPLGKALTRGLPNP